MSTEGCIEGRAACREEAGKCLCYWRWRSDAGLDKEIFVWVGHGQNSGVRGFLPVCKGCNRDRQYPRELDYIHIHRDTVFSRLSSNDLDLKIIVPYYSEHCALLIQLRRRDEGRRVGVGNFGTRQWCLWGRWRAAGISVGATIVVPTDSAFGFHSLNALSPTFDCPLYLFLARDMV